MNANSQLIEPVSYTYKQEILNPLKGLLNYYVEKHSKTMVVRFDLHFPATYPVVTDNSHISETIAYIVKKYKRRGFDPMYFWCMEQYNSIHPHYHVVVFLDGQKIRSYDHVFYTAKKAWSRALGVDVHGDVQGCVHHCNSYQGRIDMHRNGLQIRHCDGPEMMQGQMQAVYNQISYLAKEVTKAPVKDGLRNFGMSRLPMV